MSKKRGESIPRRYVYIAATLVASAILLPFQDHIWAFYLAACSGYSVLVFGLRWLALRKWRSFAPGAIGPTLTGKLLLAHANFLAVVVVWVWLLIAWAPHAPYILRTEDSDRPYLGLAFIGVLGLTLLEMFEQRFLLPELNPGFTWRQIGTLAEKGRARNVR